MKVQSLILTIKPSRIALAMVLGVHVLAVVAVTVAGLGVAVRVVLIVMVVTSAVFNLRRRNNLTLRCHAGGGLDIKEGEEWVAAALQQDSLVWPGLVMLRYRMEGRHRVAARSIFHDSLDQEDFRRLKVWLRWAAHHGLDMNLAGRGRQSD